MRLIPPLLLVALVLLLSACSDISEDNPDQQIPGPGEPPQTVIFCADCQLVDVVRVIDGDTVETSIGHVRFYGVDTPERDESCYTQATEFTELLIGTQVRLEDGPRLEDNFGRRLAYVYNASGNSIDVQLVAGGYATAWTRDGQHRDVLVGLEESARANKAGCLWGDLPAIPTPTATPVPYSPGEVDYWIAADVYSGVARAIAELRMPEYMSAFVGATATGQLESTQDSFISFVRSNDTTSLSKYSAELIPILAASGSGETMAQRIANPTTQEDADIGCWIAYSSARLRYGSLLSNLVGEMPGQCHRWYIDYQVSTAQGGTDSPWIEWLAGRLG